MLLLWEVSRGVRIDGKWRYTYVLRFPAQEVEVVNFVRSSSQGAGKEGKQRLGKELDLSLTV